MEAILSPIGRWIIYLSKEDESFLPSQSRSKIKQKQHLVSKYHNTFVPTHQTANRSKPPFSIETQSRLGRARTPPFHANYLSVTGKVGILSVLQSWKNRNTNLLPSSPLRNRVFLSSWHRSRHRWGRLIARENGAPLMLSHFANLPVYTRAYIFPLSLLCVRLHACTSVLQWWDQAKRVLVNSSQIERRNDECFARIECYIKLYREVVQHSIKRILIFKL